MKYLSIEWIKKLHIKMVDATGGSKGIRDEGLLDSAVSSIRATFDGYELYPKLEEKAARLAYALIRNHCFVDGNKRIGIYSMLVLLEINGVKLLFTQQELIELGLGVADGSVPYEQILEWVQLCKQ